MLDLIFSFAGNGCDHAYILDFYYYYCFCCCCCITSNKAWWFVLNFLEGKEERLLLGILYPSAKPDPLIASATVWAANNFTKYTIYTLYPHWSVEKF